MIITKCDVCNLEVANNPNHEEAYIYVTGGTFFSDGTLNRSYMVKKLACVRCWTEVVERVFEEAKEVK